MKKFILDGRTIEARAGATVLAAALEAGVYIPHLCHHPDLSPAGHCRLCVVECEGKGVQASCQLPVSEGLKVRTDTPRVRAARKTALELTLSVHDRRDLSPALKKAAAAVGLDLSALPAAGAVSMGRGTDESNPFFMLDRDKCVLCGVCVRTCDELVGAHALEFIGRGQDICIAPTGERPFLESNCESCGECVSRCPAGALKDRETRQPRKEVKTVCAFCGVGCSLYLGVVGGEVISARADRESSVNGGKLCVKGRYGNAFVNSPERLTSPLIRKNGEFVKAGWDEVLALVAEKFSQAKGDAFAAIGSSRAVNEEIYVMQKFARAAMGTNNVDNCARLCHAPTMAGLTRSFGTAGGTAPLSDLDSSRCILVVGSNTTAAHTVAGGRIRQAAKKGKLIVIDPRRIPLAKRADLWLPVKSGTDVALLMGMCRVILEENLHDASFVESRTEGFAEFRRALAAFDLDTVERLTTVPKELIARAARLIATVKPATIVYSLGITEHTHGVDNVLAVANLALLTGNVGREIGGVMPMRGQNNVQGAGDMGCQPASFPGSQPVAKPEAREKFGAGWGADLSDRAGLTLVEMLDGALAGRIKTMYIQGMDAGYSVPDAARTHEALRKLDFLVVQDIFLTGTAKFAHVVLPACTFAEKDGTFTNLERRVQLVRKAIEPVGESRPDWWITCEIAKRMGLKGFDYKNTSEIFDEVASLTPYYAGLSHARLEQGGVQWPVPEPGHPGTPRLHREKFNTPGGKGLFTALQYRPSFESPDEEYPFLLTTGRSLYHFHLAMTSRVPGLMKIHPRESVHIHPEDAGRLGIRDGSEVKVSSRRGSLKVRAKVTDEVLPGAAFMTFHFYESPTNVLTHQQLDPVSKTPEFKVTAVKIEPVSGKPAEADGDELPGAGS